MLESDYESIYGPRKISWHEVLKDESLLDKYIDYYLYNGNKIFAYPAYIEYKIREEYKKAKRRMERGGVNPEDIVCEH